MKIHAATRIAFPREIVFRTYRDRLVECLPYLPNVKAIEVKTRADDGPVTRLYNVWRARADIPKIAQSVIKPEMLAWDDHAVWDESALTTEWRIETHFMREAVTCGGRNAYTVEGDATVLTIDGDLAIDLRGVKGVPGFLAKAIAPAVEQLVVAMIKPNLLEVAKGVGKLLEQEKRV
jgi:hypothetical protein